jgi:hypothetical protein
VRGRLIANERTSSIVTNGSHPQAVSLSSTITGEDDGGSVDGDRRCGPYPLFA